jgi:hypothetical protein
LHGASFLHTNGFAHSCDTELRTLCSYNDTLVIDTDAGKKEFDKKSVAKVYLFEED